MIWVAADPGDPAEIPARDAAWRKALSRLNRYRNTLQARFKCTLVFAGPFSLQIFLREEAPDLWSIRSTVIRFEPVSSARIPDGFIRQLPPGRADTDDMGLGGDPTETLAEAKKIRGKPGQELLLAQLLRRAGRQAYRRLNWDLATQCLLEAYDLEESHGGDPELRFQLANELAEVFQQLALWDRALYYASRALEIAEQHFGPTHANIAIAFNNLAQLFKATNRLSEAEPLMRQALAIDEASLGRITQ
jgi:tetratricopeptide (TPR) repeat protein